MADDFSAVWERQSLFYAVQAAWGTMEDATGNPFKQIRESSHSDPYSAPPIVPPSNVGHGLPYPRLADYSQGREAAAFSTTHPMTEIALRDLCLLFFQGHYYTSTDHFVSPLAADNSVIWTPNMVFNASLVVKHDGGTSATSALKAQSCIISQLDLTIPQNTPGDTSGIGEVTASWLAEKCDRAAGFTLGTVAADSGGFYHTKDWVLEVGGLARDFVSANVSFMNGAQLDPNPAATAAGCTFGAISATGSLTCLLNQETDGGGAQPGALVDMLLDDLEGKGVSQLEFIYSPSSVETFKIYVPALLTGKPTLGEIGGIKSMTFNFTTAGSATDKPYFWFDVTTSFVSSPFYA